MSRNGSGVYSLPAGNPVVTGTTISSTWANTTLSDIATALTGSVASDGQTAMTGNLQMGNNKVTGLAAPTSTGDALSFNNTATVSSLTVTGNASVGGTFTLTGGLTLNGNVIVGDSSSDTLTVNATSTFAAGATFSSTFAANGGATLGDASGDALTINSSAVSIPNGLNFDSNTFVIDATNNRVGIGTASPSHALQVAGSNGIVANFSASVQAGIQIASGGAFNPYMNFFSSGTTQEAGIFAVAGSAALAFTTTSAGTERMRITNTGNVGIGNSTPRTNLHIGTAPDTTSLAIPSGTFAAIRGAAYTSSGGTAGIQLSGGFGDNGNVGAWNIKSVATSSGGFVTNNNLLFTTTLSFSGTETERMRLDSSGNLGLGVTPSAWVSTWRAMDIGVGAAVYSNGANNAALAANAYNIDGSGGWRYKGSGNANLFQTSGGQFLWYTAPSGTAGNAVSFTQAMTLDASGNLLVGTTSGSGFSNKYIDINDSTDNCGINLKVADVGQGYIYVDDSSNEMRVAATGASNVNALTLFTGGSERMRIDSSGNLLVGRTSASATGAGLWLYNTGSFGRINFGTSTTGTSDYCVFYNNSGTGVGGISSTTTATTYATSSDYRLKNTIAPMTGALAKVAQLKPVTYKWNADGSDGEGFIAHELAEVIPQAVVGEKDAVDEEGNPKYQGIDTSFLVATLTAALQELNAKVDSLQAELNTLKGN